MKARLLHSSFIAFIFLCFVFSANAQQAEKKKEHYRIINLGNDDPYTVEKALYHSNLDSLRFVNERRRIKIEGTSLTLELFSGQELLDNYKKPIHPNNINDPATAKKYILRFKGGMLVAIQQD